MQKLRTENHHGSTAQRQSQWQAWVPTEENKCLERKADGRTILKRSHLQQGPKCYSLIEVAGAQGLHLKCLQIEL